MQTPRGKVKKLAGWALASVLLLIPLRPVPVAARQAAPARGEELWISVRLTPGVSDETLRYLNDLVAPKQRNVRGGENLLAVLKSTYGDAYVRALGLLRKDNPEEVLSRLEEGKGGSLLLPLSPLYYRTVISRIQGGERLRDLITRQTGKADSGTVDEVRRITSSLKSYCRKERGCTREEQSLSRRDDLVALPYASRYVSFPLKVASAEQLAAAMERLKGDAGVADVEVHRRLSLIPNFDFADASGIGAGCVQNPTDTAWPSRQLGLEQVRVEDLRAVTTQATVAVLDTGIIKDDPRFTLWRNPPEADRGANLIDEDSNEYPDDVSGFDFVKRRPFPVDDSFGLRYEFHGTHVAGLASGVFLRSPPSAAVAAVLFEARQHVRPMILKVAWEDGTVDSGAVIEAIQYARDMGAHVVNMSFAGPASIKSIRVEIARSPNLLFVAAAGNGDDDHIGQDLNARDFFPAKYSRDFANLVSVAAHDEKRRLPCFSNFGAETVDLAAPGVQVESTVGGDDYVKANGTSQAAPLVALTASLLRALGLDSPPLMKQRLLASVDFVPGLRGRLTSEGALNVAKALSFRDDLIELGDEGRTLLRGRIIAAPQRITVGGRDVKFADVRKIVNFSPEAGAPMLQRVTLLREGKLEHVYGELAMPKLKFKDTLTGQCSEIALDAVRDIIPATLPPAVPETCPE